MAFGPCAGWRWSYSWTATRYPHSNLSFGCAFGEKASYQEWALGRRAASQTKSPTHLCRWLSQGLLAASRSRKTILIRTGFRSLWMDKMRHRSKLDEILSNPTLY